MYQRVVNLAGKPIATAVAALAAVATGAGAVVLWKSAFQEERLYAVGDRVAKKAITKTLSELGWVDPWKKLRADGELMEVGPQVKTLVEEGDDHIVHMLMGHTMSGMSTTVLHYAMAHAGPILYIAGRNGSGCG